MAHHVASAFLALVLLPMCFGAPLTHLHTHHHRARLLTTPTTLVQQRAVSARALLQVPPGTYDQVKGAKCMLKVKLSFSGSKLDDSFYPCAGKTVNARAVPGTIQPNDGRRRMLANPSSLAELTQAVQNAAAGLIGLVGTAVSVIGKKDGDVTVTVTMFFESCVNANSARLRMRKDRSRRRKFTSIVDGATLTREPVEPARVPGPSGSESITCPQRAGGCLKNKNPEFWYDGGKRGTKQRKCRCNKLCRVGSSSFAKPVAVTTCRDLLSNCVRI